MQKAISYSALKYLMYLTEVAVVGDAAASLSKRFGINERAAKGDVGVLDVAAASFELLSATA